MKHLNESVIEQAALTLLESLGYLVMCMTDGIIAVRIVEEYA